MTIFFGILILLSFIISAIYSDELIKADTKEQSYRAIIILFIWVSFTLFFTYCFYRSIIV